MHSLSRSMCSVCTSAGVVASYANRPMFPESCRYATMDDKSTYTTMLRIAGSFATNGPIFEAIMQYYGWKHFVLISDTNMAPCLYAVTPIFDYMDARRNFSVYWIRMSDSPTETEIDDYLQQISERARGTINGAAMHRCDSASLNRARNAVGKKSERCYVSRSLNPRHSLHATNATGAGTTRRSVISFHSCAIGIEFNVKQ